MSGRDPLRLLFLCERFPPDLGGVATSAGRTAAALARAGCEVDVVAWTRGLPPGELASSQEGPGLAFHRVGLYGELDFSLQHTLTVLEWLHQRRGFQAVWGHWLFPPGFVAAWFAAGAGLPALVSARGNDLDRMAFPPGDFARLRWTLERAALLVAPSHDLLEKAARITGPARPSLLVPNSVDPDLFAPGPPDPALRARLGIAPDEAVLGFAGELREKKGLSFLLEALLEVRRTRPACLLVIGEVRPREQARLAELAATHPQDAARVLVTGHLPERAAVAAHLREVDLFLHPSRWDGLPNALLEAMACERLVLASDAGGIPEAIEPGTSGFLLPRWQLHRLGQAALELLSRPAAERQAIGRAARARALAAFHPAAEEAALAAALARLARPRREPPSALE